MTYISSFPFRYLIIIFMLHSLIHMSLCFRIAANTTICRFFPLPNNVIFFLQFGHLAFVLRCTFFSFYKKDLGILASAHSLFYFNHKFPHVGHSVVVKLSCLYVCTLFLMSCTIFVVKSCISCINFR